MMDQLRLASFDLSDFSSYSYDPEHQERNKDVFMTLCQETKPL